MAAIAAPPQLPAATVDGLLSERARSHPGDVAFRFVNDPRALDDERSVTTVTCAELDAGARAIAAQLLGCARPGERVVLLHAPGPAYIEAFFACLLAGAVAVPANQPTTPSAAERLRAVVADCEPALVLTDADHVESCDAVLAGAGSPLRARVLDASAPTPAGVTGLPESDDPERVAFLQYTSGSTGNPRGVMVTHANLVANMLAMQQAFQLRPGDRELSWLPPYHDMGLILGILHPICMGLETVLMSPFAFLVDPLCWLESVSRFRATFSGGPNFAYELCVRRADPARTSRLDLGCWRVAFSGAEPVRRQTLEKFVSTYADAGFRATTPVPGYGLAEATLMVSGAPPGRAVRTAGAALDTCGGEVVSVGHPVVATEVRIVDPATARECPEGTVGEVWISGPGVARGYWNRAEETETVFHACLDGMPGAGFLRTGDLGFVRDGELYVTGRIKDVIIVCGQNHYPQDIEESVWRADSTLRAGCGVAFGVEAAGEERVVVVQECADPAAARDRIDAIAAAVRRTVQRDTGLRLYELVLVEPRSVLKTSAGKLRRSAMRAAWLEGGLQVVAAVRFDGD